MKKNLLMLFFALCAMTANAQFYVGGPFGYTNTTIKATVNEDEESMTTKLSGSSYKIMREVGYKLDDNWSFGVSFGYAHGYSAMGAFDVNDVKGMSNALVGSVSDVLSEMPNGAIKLNTFCVAPYARYTFLRSGKMELFLEGSLGYSSVKVDGTLGDIVDPTVKLYEVLVRPGIALNITKHIQAVAKVGSLGYQHAKLDMGMIKPTLDRFGFDFDSNNILLGFNYHF